MCMPVCRRIVFKLLCFFPVSSASTPSDVQGMTLNCIRIFIVTSSFLYWCVMRPVSQCFFIQICIYLRILIKSCLATFLVTNSLSVLMCRKAVNQSINLQAAHVANKDIYISLNSSAASCTSWSTTPLHSLKHLKYFIIKVLKKSLSVKHMKVPWLAYEH